MAFSKQVATVIGMCCLSREFRAAFFLNPTGKAVDLVGRLTAEEIGHVLRVAGENLPTGLIQQPYVSRLKLAFDEADDALSCPMPPCPDPNNF